MIDAELEVTPEQTRDALADGSAQVIDVRRPEELEAGRIEGMRHIELDELTAQAETIDRDRPVIFFCRSGARSLMAAQAFRQAGYDARSAAGGIIAWDAAGLPR